MTTYKDINPPTPKNLHTLENLQTLLNVRKDVLNNTIAKTNRKLMNKYVASLWHQLHNSIYTTNRKITNKKCNNLSVMDDLITV